MPFICPEASFFKEQRAKKKSHDEFESVGAFLPFFRPLCQHFRLHSLVRKSKEEKIQNKTKETKAFALNTCSKYSKNCKNMLSNKNAQKQWQNTASSEIVLILLLHIKSFN